MADGYSYVALLDVLGYRFHVKSDREHNRLTFKEKLTAGMGALSEINEDDLRRVAISDTIILSTSNSGGLEFLIKACADLYVSFMKQGLLLRGGVAYSQHFHNGNVTYSHALTMAHELESSAAKWPRILVSEDAINASRELGFEVGDKGLMIEWNGKKIIDPVLASDWEGVFKCASSIYESSLPCDEDVFMKHILLEGFLLNHPQAKNRKKKYTSKPVAA